MIFIIDGMTEVKVHTHLEWFLKFKKGSKLREISVTRLSGKPRWILAHQVSTVFIVASNVVACPKRRREDSGREGAIEKGEGILRRII